MDNQTERPETAFGQEELRRHSFLAVVLGVLLIIIGSVALGISVAVSFESMLFIGWIMIIGGIIQGIHAFSADRRHHALLKVLLATLYVVVGIMVVVNPLAAELGLALLLIAFFLVAGVSRIAAALRGPMPNRWSILTSGVVAVLLGIFLWEGWPITGLWVIGAFVGVDLIFEGWTVLMIGVAGRHIVPGQIPHAPQV